SAVAMASIEFLSDLSQAWHPQGALVGEPEINRDETGDHHFPAACPDGISQRSLGANRDRLKLCCPASVQSLSEISGYRGSAARARQGVKVGQPVVTVQPGGK